MISLNAINAKLGIKYLLIKISVIILLLVKFKIAKIVIREVKKDAKIA
jgi:hypothetical protein